MKLARFKITNCSRIADVDIEVRDNMVIIGPNGAGKTTMLLCLDMLLGMNNQQLYGTLSEKFIRDETRPLIIEAAFDGLDSGERAIFSDELAMRNDNTFAIRLDAFMEGDDIVITRGFPSCAPLGQEPNAQAKPTEFHRGPSNAQKGAIGWALIDDGTRALLGTAAHELLRKGANILAIDEPEAHLHPSSQRSLVKMLKASGGQKVLVTHSPTIAGSFEPDEIVVIRADGCAVQPERGFLGGNAGMLARWWIGKQLEPLTAGAVIAVEGPSDRIIVDRIANVSGFDLDRHDVVIVETNGCGDMKVVESIFGAGGFDIPLFELIDADASIAAAKRFDVETADLETCDVFVSTKDLEDEYVRAIGAKQLWGKLRTSGTFSKNVLRLCAVGPDGYPTETDLAEFIREKSNRKIPSALIAAELIDEANAPGVESVAKLLEAASQHPSNAIMK